VDYHVMLTERELQRHSTTKGPWPIGQIGMTQDGRKFAYAKAAGALGGKRRAVINSNYCPGATGHTDEDGFEGALQVAASAGDKVVYIADTTERDEDYYEGAYLVIFGSDEFEEHFILSSEAGDGTKVKLTLASDLQNDIATSVGVTVYVNPYAAVKAAMSTGQEYEPFVGVPLVAVASGEYCWLQIAGPIWVTAHGGTWPGSAAHYRDVFFHMDGTIDPSSVCDPTSGYQRAGYLLSQTISGYGDAWIMLQLR